MQISIDRIDDHPDNANRMNDAPLAKLAAHIERSGRYPPLIVRPHPTSEDRYQLIDGHHRLKALRKLGHVQAICEVWSADDAQVTELLLTLNRLHGEDDPFRRAALMAKLTNSITIEELARRLPENVERIRRLTALLRPPAAPASPPFLDDMPQTVTFVMTTRQRSRLLSKLRTVCEDRTRALLDLLNLKDTDEAAADTNRPATERGPGRESEL